MSKILLTGWAALVLIMGETRAQKRITFEVKRTQQKVDHKVRFQKALSQSSDFLHEEAFSFNSFEGHQYIKNLTEHIFGLSYTSSLYFGSQESEADLVFDTGSGWLTVSHSECHTCTNKIYNPKTSNTSVISDSSTKSLKYGSAKLEGYTIDDQVCLSKTVNETDHRAECIPQFNFFAITNQEGLSQADGILGLTPSSSDNGPSFLKALKVEGHIDEAQASFLLRHQGSTFTFGSYDPKIVKAGSEEQGYGVHWYELTGNHYWQVKIQDIIVHQESVYSGKTNKAILDSGTSFITVPNSDFEKIKTLFSKRHSTDFGCQNEGTLCFFLGACKDKIQKLDPILIQLGDDWDFGVPPEDYMLDYEEANTKYCILGISPGDYGLYILGDSFLRSYLNIYDFENNKAGLAIHKYSKAVVSKHKDGPRWMLPLVITTISLFIMMFAIVIYKRYKKNQLVDDLAQYKSRASIVDKKLYGENGDQTEWLVDEKESNQQQLVTPKVNYVSG